MKREILDDLRNWHARRSRKPLVLRGARQVGKTWIVRELARRVGADLVEINFERAPQVADVFEERAPARVLQALERLKGRRIHKERSLLLLDEIQRAPQAFANLRWFHEECPELAVIATGSLLDFVLARHSFSMPVGRISYMFMEPMTFYEFLLASGEEPLGSLLREATIEMEIEEPVHDKLCRLFRLYTIIGGMPAIVQEWNDSGSPVAVSEVQQDLINTLCDDFARYAARLPPERLRKVMLSIPRLLGRKYKYSLVDRNEGSRELKRALELLAMARICHKVRHSGGRGVPLVAEENDARFKVLFIDTGLASAVLGLVLDSRQALQDLVRIDRGGIAEQAVGQLLRGSVGRHVDPRLHYYLREKRGSEAEIDYLIQTEGRIVPVEVKSGATGTLKSLHQFMADRGCDMAFRVNTERPSRIDVDFLTPKGDRSRYELLSVPLYLAGELGRLSSSR